MALLGFTLCGIAYAWLSPTQSERNQITRAAQSADGSDQQTVRVSGIRVSTVGPWATAAVAIYRRGSARVEQAEQDTFYKDHGSWIDTASASAPNIAMPSADEKNLGLASSEFGGSGFQIYLLACWFLGLAGIVDVLLQPARAFDNTGRSKLKWLMIETLGAPLTGIFTWAYYAVRVRPQLVAAGGRRPRRALRGFLDILAKANTESRSRPSNTPNHPPQRFSMACSSCAGNGSQPCGSCGGTGKLGAGAGPRTAYSASVANTRTCEGCNGAGKRTCTSCKGTGRVGG
jgi:hypothetical protein